MACSRCGATENRDGSEVTWVCQVCDGKVCHECTLKIGEPQGAPRIPLEYYFETLCSAACWEKAGRPED